MNTLIYGIVSTLLLLLLSFYLINRDANKRKPTSNHLISKGIVDMMGGLEATVTKMGAIIVYMAGWIAWLIFMV